MRRRIAKKNVAEAGVGTRLGVGAGLAADPGIRKAADDDACGLVIRVRQAVFGVL